MEVIGIVLAILDSTLAVTGVLQDGNTVGWYIASDLSTITKDGSNKVSVWADKLASGHNLAADPTNGTFF